MIRRRVHIITADGVVCYYNIKVDRDNRVQLSRAKNDSGWNVCTHITVYAKCTIFCCGWAMSGCLVHLYSRIPSRKLLGKSINELYARMYIIQSFVRRTTPRVHVFYNGVE